MLDHNGINDLFYLIAMILFFASPIIVIAVTAHYFSSIPTDNKKFLKLVVVASIIISPFLATAFDNLTTGLGFRIFLFPFYCAKWIGILISVYFIVYQLINNTIIKKQSLIVPAVFILVYMSNSTMLEYAIDAKHPADTPNNSLNERDALKRAP